MLSSDEDADVLCPQARHCAEDTGMLQGASARQRRIGQGLVVKGDSFWQVITCQQRDKVAMESPVAGQLGVKGGGQEYSLLHGHNATVLQAGQHPYAVAYCLNQGALMKTPGKG